MKEMQPNCVPKEKKDEKKIQISPQTDDLVRVE